MALHREIFMFAFCCMADRPRPWATVWGTVSPGDSPSAEGDYRTYTHTHRTQSWKYLGRKEFLKRNQRQLTSTGHVFITEFLFCCRAFWEYQCVFLSSVCPPFNSLIFFFSPCVFSLVLSLFLVKSVYHRERMNNKVCTHICQSSNVIPVGLLNCIQTPSPVRRAM